MRPSFTDVMKDGTAASFSPSVSFAATLPVFASMASKIDHKPGVLTPVPTINGPADGR